MRRCGEVGFDRAVAEVAGDSNAHRGTYFGNDWKVLTAADAKAFAVALRQAIDHLQGEIRFVELLESGPVLSS